MLSYRDRLTAFYEKYAPNKLGQVDAQLGKYTGLEEDFFAALVKKYGPEPAAAAAVASLRMSPCADTHESNAPEARAGHDIFHNTAVEEEEGDAIANHVPDEGRQVLLRALAAELGIVVKSEETFLVLGALLDERRAHNLGTGALPNVEAGVYRALNGSVHALSSPQLTMRMQTVVLPPHSVADLSELLAAVRVEEAKSRTALELLAADDFDILLAAQRQGLRYMERNITMSALRAFAEAALLRRVWRGWQDAATGRDGWVRYGQRRQWTRYQKMLFSKSVAAYYARLAQSQRDRERRRWHVRVANAKAEAVRRRRLQRDVVAHGNIVTRNILAVLLSPSPGAHRPRNILATPEPSPDAVPASAKSVWQGAHSQCRARSPYWLGDTVGTHGSGTKKNNCSTSRYSYGSRSARLLAIERDFGSIPASARAHVVRTLKKWDMLPTSPSHHASRSPTRLHTSQGGDKQLARRLDTFDAFAVDPDEDTPPLWWESETELQRYLARILVDALDAEERDDPPATAA
ncbi:hypothetical protein TraAM80_06539 [Trypanosoma rangeli]|uniref:Uncharacterized protein n=1 Tax=Trypanosoma rangeli TaxID=5698 RepID=A0A3R7KVK8_TRYRA|nr:uncharacterized protein TraAM80_06539 [Trypanosoma rangeli]RNF02245.1 hypothetical protein TraAM80_06539 [Trypanosoma rangeli]|eukprot:RNF02245.1 hypothetical protein TraAM80_06539 [Trypanosoma rangeli]